MRMFYGRALPMKKHTAAWPSVYATRRFRVALDRLAGRARLARLALFASLVATPCAHAAIGTDGKVAVDGKSFGCITQMQPVRGFYVGNLRGNLKGTLSVANSKTGGVYPVGSVIQLVPTEVMVKQPTGFNAATRDWEFFELDVSKDGSRIRKRGFVEVVNRFGGNCFACHVKARPEWDMVCETGHGCDPIPLTTRMIGALQRTDPRCRGSQHVSADDAAALKDLAAVTQGPGKKGGT
jgi:hypothetical protein